MYCINLWLSPHINSLVENIVSSTRAFAQFKEESKVKLDVSIVNKVFTV